MKNKNIVYVSMIADMFHGGHMSVLNKAADYGNVIVGLLTDKACTEINDMPYLSYKYRESVLLGMSCVTNVIPQDDASGIENMKKIGATVVVHGDNWVTGHLAPIRKQVKDYIESIGGKLVETPYLIDISAACPKEQMSILGTTTTMRMNQLRRLLMMNRPVKIIEVHNAISALIAEKVSYNNDTFDGMWSSSLTDSTAKGKPDIEAVDTTARLNTVNEIFEVTTKPMIYDGDTGGKIELFPFTVKALERTGISAVIIEDKCGLKKNSLFGTDVPQEQDTIENFCAKIRAGKQAQISNSFMIIARVESFILGKDCDDALTRSFAYIEAGADGIMIHSKEKHGKDIFEFLERFREVNATTPVVVVPSSYNTFTATELYEAGANIIIYANHMMRSAYPAMLKTAKSILEHGKSEFADKEYCMSIKDILELIPGTK